MASASGDFTSFTVTANTALFAGEFGFRIVRRESHIDIARLAHFGADELVLEAGNELPRAEHEVEVLRLAARKLLSVDAADEIHRHRVALLRGFAFRTRGIGARLFGQAHHPVVHIGVGDVGHQALDLELRDVGQIEIGHQIDQHTEFEIGLALDHLLHIADRLDARREGRLERIVGNRLLAAFVDGGLDDLAHHRLAIGLLEERNGGLARPEALEAQTRPDLLDLAGQTLFQIGGPDHDCVFATQAFGNGLGNLHMAYP